MNLNLLKIIILSVIFIFSFTACFPEYSKHVEEYRSLFEQTVSLLDSENVYDSIVNNNLTVNVEKLDGIMSKMEETVPKNKDTEFLMLRQKHEFLKDIVKKGLQWDSLGGLDKMLIKENIEMYKTK